MTVKTMTPRQAHTLAAQGKALIVDVREPGEFSAEHIACAVSVPLAQVASGGLRGLPQNHAVVFQCQRGKRAEQACSVIRSAKEWKNACLMEGGLDAWKAAGLPVVRAAPGLPVQRQVHLAVGLGVVAGILGGTFIHPALYAAAGAFGCGLAFAGLTGWCGLALLLKKAPWNTAA